MHKVVRAIVSSLEKERTKLMRDDTKYHTTNEDKEKTLIAEWSGANDLATVSTALLHGNIEAAKKQASEAVKARLENVEKLMAGGYKNFVLFTLPDMAKSPRFNTPGVSDEHRRQVSEVCQFFNEELKAGIGGLQRAHPKCCVVPYEVDKEFQEIYGNPTKYGFATDTRLQANNQVAAGKAVPLFNDDVHPSTQAHQIIAERFETFCNDRFDNKIGQEFKYQNKSAQELIGLFKEAHALKFVSFR